MNDVAVPARAEPRVSVPVAVDLTAEEKSWLLDHPTQANQALASWYAHNRRCRRAHRRAHRTFLEPVLCRCAIG